MNYYVLESSYIDEDAHICEETKIWFFCHIQRGARIGRNCSLGQNVNISNNVKIGDGVKIQNNVSVYEGVEIEDDEFCGPSCVFANYLTPRAKYPKGHNDYKRTVVKRGAGIVAKTTIVCGSAVGENALISAVITKDVPAYTLVRGVHGEAKGRVEKMGNIVECYENIGGDWINNNHTVSSYREVV